MPPRVRNGLAVERLARFAAAVFDGWRVVRLMGVFHRPPDLDGFEAFVERVKPTLLQALIATYGPVDGREACLLYTSPSPRD